MYQLEIIIELRRDSKVKRTSSFSIVASATNRTSSCTSKENIGPDLPLYLFTMKSSMKKERR